MPRVVTWLHAPRPIWLMLALSLALGIGFAALVLLPSGGWGFLDGTSAFWIYPPSLLSATDAAAALVAFLATAHSPWTLPLLHVPSLNAPAGMNAFWLDPLPWLVLAGRGLFSVTGRVVNLLGAYRFACLAANGVAMTALLAVLGHRSVLSTVAGSVLALCTPWLLFRWENANLMGQFMLILALALYLAERGRSGGAWRRVGWVFLVLLALLTNFYLFVMVAALCAASMGRRLLTRTASIGRLGAEAVGFAALTGAVLVLLGVFPQPSTQFSTSDYGTYSLDIASPMVPQMSGLVPWRAHAALSRIEGFAYLGGGVWMLLIVLRRDVLAFLRQRWRSHIALLVILTVLLILAISNQVTIADHPLFTIPLPTAVLGALGAFRSAARFFWPTGYVLFVIAIVLTLRSQRPNASAALLAAACVLQVVDTFPLRAAIAQSVSGPAPSAIDRAAAERAVTAADSVMIYPSYVCLMDEGRRMPPTQVALLVRNLDVAMEYQVIAARQNKPTNSFYAARKIIDCAHESEVAGQPLRPGALYVFLSPPGPPADARCITGHGYAQCVARTE